MFTGLVEEIGTVRRILPGRDSVRIRIQAPRLAPELRTGDSVAVDGVCLTLTETQGDDFEATAVSQTLKQSTLGRLRTGERVNLERALALGDRLGGHLVQGHVDGVGSVVSVRPKGDSRMITVRIPAGLMRQVAERGSVALNGVSLTVALLERERITVSVIPHTFENTTLKELAPGSRVNVETDLFAKYAERLLSRDQTGTKIGEVEMGVEE
ncbi:MAG: riboflavin synthase [bacterium]|nr:riboflavin synthase [bacterium]